MKRFLFAPVAMFLALSLSWAGLARAQSAEDVVWVQIEAQPSLAEATDRARAYETLLDDVNGFSLGGGWYGIAVGPYRRADAELVLRSYVRDGLVPRDSFIQQSDRFRQQFWPVGANVLETGVIDAPAGVETGDETETASETTTPEVTTTPLDPTTPAEAEAEGEVETEVAEAEPETAAAPEPPEPDETPAEARRTERALTAQERKDLQIALQWAGFYDASIDGAFGRGTRASMGAWQAANGYDQTGVLTTRQRAALIAQYNAVLDGLGLQMVRDEKAGIEIMMPTAEVEFARYEPPFAHYDTSGNLGARVLLISQSGNQDTLYGLYDIMQTLEIVPLDGPRERKRNSFELIGENGSIISQTQVSLENGEIKGFTLIWPAGDEDRRRRVLAEMSKSLTRLPNVLDAAAGNSDAQAIDLVAGLQIRQPKIARSGFFIDDNGSVVTTSEVVASCSRVTLDADTDATVVATDEARGLALLKPESRLAPLAVAEFGNAAPRLQSEISVAGYSYEGVLSAATLTFGALSDLKGLNGDATLKRLSVKAQPGDAGGPVFDERGHVVGMLLPRTDGDRKLPEDVSFALDGGVILKAAESAGLGGQMAQGAAGPIAPRDLTLRAQGMTVLVSCWE
ncbi:trypsin-like peptidase domain-containing protein [Sulfitobacter sp. W027]|uniref:serine protease n=1 Tax=Sulfitobacter sp. W027 TaxID=2867025 RepID=UPI0021A732E8|nr:serine protease [Sulfitobacter sp. W027]UWR34521.1 trypsin-like peptidase domain-containing protein [Sulfitobacter sp. W027]